MSPPFQVRRSHIPTHVFHYLGLGILGLILLSPPLVLGGPSLTSGGGSVSPPPRAPSGFVTVAPALPPGGATELVGPLEPSTAMTVVVALAPSDPAGLAFEERLLYASGKLQPSQEFTPSELASRFATSESTYRAAASYFVSYGLSVQESPDRLLFTVSGPSAGIANSFHTQFDTYRTGSRTFFSHSTPATLPVGLPWAGVLGLGNETALRPYTTAVLPTLAFPAAGCNGNGSLVPCQIQNAYAETPLLVAGENGAGYRIGVVDRYDGAEPQTTLASDFAGFTTMFALPGGGVSYLYPVPTSTNLNATSTQWGVEEALDMQWARALAPDAQIDMTFSPDASGGLYAAVDWLVSHQAVNVISLSWGEPDVGVFNSFSTPCVVACNATSDGSYDILSPVLSEAALEGIGVFAASGDCGAADGTNGVSTNFPASDPSVMGVGGTDLAVNSSGGYLGEVGWSGNQSGAVSPGCQNQGGAGGGYSPFPRPGWQTGTGLPATPATRAVPDVSLVAGSPVMIRYNGANLGVAGTSEASPMWAGIEAVLDQNSGTSLGLLTPSFYQLLRSVQYPSVFHDILSGSNGYASGVGWDPVTGIGTPILDSLAAALTVSTPSSSTLVTSLGATPRAGPTPLLVNFRVNTTGGRPPYALYNVNFGDGNSSTAPGGIASHVYRFPGAFAATAVAFDSGSNLSIAPPVAIVVGGGLGLNVTLNVSTSTPPTGARVSFNTSVRGGVAPFRYYYAFGDGTYLNWSSSESPAHVYYAPGGFCASVVVSDSSHPVDGASSNRVSISVGGSGLPACARVTPLRATLAAGLLTADAPAEFSLQVAPSGGSPPYTVAYTSDDPYVRACQCGILRSPGTHLFKAFVNDSGIDSVVLVRNVTVYPALAASFSASTQSGAAPLGVTFHVTASGGNRTNASSTQWIFGDGSSALGATVAHTYTSAGYYLAIADLMDSGFGNASEAFLIDVEPNSSSRALIVTANVTPAVRWPAGSPVAFRAGVSGGLGPYLIRWDLGVNDSAFGPSVNQTYSAVGCLARGTCPLIVTLRVEEANGAWENLSLSLSPPISHRSSALVLSDYFPSLIGGPPPWTLAGTAQATGISLSTIRWQFGDGTTGTGASVFHVYAQAGNFTLTETATDPLGDLLVRTHAIVVVREAPTIIGGPANASGLAPLTVNFSARASGGSGGPYTYSWAFGDGNSSAANPTSHTYSIPGSYAATLLVFDRLGISSSASFPIEVYSITPVDWVFTTSPIVVAGEMITIQSQDSTICTSTSVPTCGPAGIPITIGETTNLSLPGTVIAYGQTGLGGFTNFSLRAPAMPGLWWLVGTVESADYSGRFFLEVEVVAPSPSSTSPIAGEILLVGAFVGMAVGVALLVRSRRDSRGKNSAANP